jgi:hypothetical protein
LEANRQGDNRWKNRLGQDGLEASQEQCQHSQSYDQKFPVVQCWTANRLRFFQWGTIESLLAHTNTSLLNQ